MVAGHEGLHVGNCQPKWSPIPRFVSVEFSLPQCPAFHRRYPRKGTTTSASLQPGGCSESGLGVSVILGLLNLLYLSSRGSVQEKNRGLEAVVHKSQTSTSLDSKRGRTRVPSPATQSYPPKSQGLESTQSGSAPQTKSRSGHAQCQRRQL